MRTRCCSFALHANGGSLPAGRVGLLQNSGITSRQGFSFALQE
jgi:hypothetical protein